MPTTPARQNCPADTVRYTNANHGPLQDRALTLVDKIGSGPGASRVLDRRQVAPAERARQPQGLILGTEEFTESWLSKWHQSNHQWNEDDVACYKFRNAVVSGAGQVWLGGSLVSSSEIMPGYVANFLQVQGGGSDDLLRQRSLPLRRVDHPCILIAGHGADVYGHFIIEALFRLIVAQDAFPEAITEYKILLDTRSPAWLVKILVDDLGIGDGRIEWIDSYSERILATALLAPTMVHHQDRFHPKAEKWVKDLAQRLAPSPEKAFPKKIFVSRLEFDNPSAPQRRCLNEAGLIEMAAKRGVEPVAPHRMSWREQIALFEQAEVIVGIAGSGLHNALFSRAGTRVASIGFRNLVQSGIGALRGHQNAFYTEDVSEFGDFTVDENRFSEFMDLICDFGVRSL